MKMKPIDILEGAPLRRVSDILDFLSPTFPQIRRAYLLDSGQATSLTFMIPDNTRSSLFYFDNDFIFIIRSILSSHLDDNFMTLRLPNLVTSYLCSDH